MMVIFYDLKGLALVFSIYFSFQGKFETESIINKYGMEKDRSISKIRFPDL